MKSINLNPGDVVWVVGRNESLEPEEVAGMLFIAQAAGYAIAAPFPFGCDTVEDMMEYFAEQTREMYSTDVSIYPVADCFPSKAEAKEHAGFIT